LSEVYTSLINASEIVQTQNPKQPKL